MKNCITPTGTFTPVIKRGRMAAFPRVDKEVLDLISFYTVDVCQDGEGDCVCVCGHFSVLFYRCCS